MDKLFYVYAHIRLDTKTVFYIGKGSKKRAWSKNDRNQYWCSIVKKHKYQVVILDYFENEEDAFKREEQLIMWHRFFGDCEANICSGGLGGHRGLTPWNKGISRPEDTKEKISKKLTGVQLPECIKEKISLGGKGLKRSDETKKRMSKSFTGRKFKEGSGLNISLGKGCKPFNVFIALGCKRHWTKGRFVGTWVNRTECGRELNIQPNIIGLCLKGERKQCYGYIFEYTDSIEDELRV
jgi:hypothetical protein